MYWSTNGSPNGQASLAEPEVWFRIVNVAVDVMNGAPVAA
jgi:hypothetical protein